MEKKDTITEELSSTLNVLASKLGVKVEELYSAVIAQAKIELVMSILYLIGITVMFMLSVKGINSVIPYWLADETFKAEKQVFVIFKTIASGIGLIITIVSFLSILQDIITLWLNPKYWALQDILHSVRNE